MKRVFRKGFVLAGRMYGKVQLRVNAFAKDNRWASAFEIILMIIVSILLMIGVYKLLGPQLEGFIGNIGDKFSDLIGG